jgi:hypothetical protein
MSDKTKESFQARARAISLLLDSLDTQLGDDGVTFDEVEATIVSVVDHLEESGTPKIVLDYMKVALMALPIIWGLRDTDTESDGELIAQLN